MSAALKSSARSGSKETAVAMRQAVSEILARHIRAGYAAGAVALVAHGDAAEVVVAGDASREAATPMRRDSIFRVSSMTKPLTATVALMLIEEGRLQLQEPIERLLPELAARRVLRRPDADLADTVAARRSITVADLLTYRWAGASRSRASARRCSGASRN